MCISVVQNRCQDIWTSVEPYLVPCAVASGVTFLVNQIWGNIAALCFAAGAVGMGVAFPYLVTEITKDDVLMGFARLVLIAVLPFFGPLGIAGSVGLSALSSLTQDVRLYAIRAKVAEAGANAFAIEKKHEDIAKERKTMIEECDKKNQVAETYWHSVRPVNSVYQALEKYERMIQDNQAFLIKTLEQFGASGDYKAAEAIIDDIKRLKAFIDSLTAENLEINKYVNAALLRIRPVLEPGVPHGNN